MNVFKKKDVRTIDVAIDEVLEEMRALNPASDAYTAMAKNLETLEKARAQHRAKRPTGDQVLGVVANVAGMVMILNYEKVGIIATKAFSILPKVRV